jgi:hypothetical protein
MVPGAVLGTGWDQLDTVGHGHARKQVPCFRVFAVRQSPNQMGCWTRGEAD